jgi:nucleotide-binding universal stress UspA family protein
MAFTVSRPLELQYSGACRVKIRAVYENNMKILLAIDESTVSQEAIRKVIVQFVPKRTTVRILHVVEPITGYISADMMPHFVQNLPNVEKDRLKQAEKLVQSAAVKLRQAGFRTTSIVENGDPRVQIVDRASAWRADLIVVGSHGLRGLPRLLMGSVAESVARHAACSVEIVRMGKVQTRKAQVSKG